MITNENFEQEVLKSDKPVLLRFYLEEGCGFCDKYAPIFEAYALAHPEIKCVSTGKKNAREGQTELELKFGVNSFPTTIAFNNGKMIRKEIGVLTDEKFASIFKTLQTIPDDELVGVKLDLEIEAANKRRELHKIEAALRETVAEIARRLLPSSTGDEKQETVTTTKAKEIDYSSFPQTEEAPCDGCQ